jgi:FlaA1/EpsC-like NDP-sugar epimerase
VKKLYRLFILKYRKIFVFLGTLFLIILSYYIAFLMRFDGRMPEQYYNIFVKTLPILILVKIIVFYFFKLFQGIWKYVSVYDLENIIKANLTATIIFIVGNIFFHGSYTVPRFIFINDFIICTFFIGGIRFLSRIIKERGHGLFLKNGYRKNTLIIGAGEAGMLLLKEYINNPGLGDIVGFIDDDKGKRGEVIHGIKVLGGKDVISNAVSKHSVEEIIIAMPSAKGEIVRDFIACCTMPDISLKIIPSIAKLISGELNIMPRRIEPEDLLGREPVKIDETSIKKYVKNKTVLVTGAAGSIGSELCRQICDFSPAKIVLLDHNENNLYFLDMELKGKQKNLSIFTVVGDITDIGLLKKVFSLYKPQIVFHAAAYKHVPLMEENPIAAVKNNIFGSRNLIYASNHYKVERFVLISTDKAVNPINTMGLSKRLAEILMQSKAGRSNTKFMAVRFGNVLGSDGSIVPLLKKQIEAGSRITITHPEATRYFMSIKEAVLLVLQAGAIGSGGELFILDMGEQIKIIDLAKDLVALSGFELGKDVFVEYIGLRPGEKISEDLLLDKEKACTTKHDKIYISRSGDYDIKRLNKDMKELERWINIMADDKVASKIRDMIQVYK